LRKNINQLSPGFEVSGDNWCWLLESGWALFYGRATKTLQIDVVGVVELRKGGKFVENGLYRLV
jgi:hypothetical protein